MDSYPDKDTTPQDTTPDITTNDADPSTRGGPPFWVVGVIVLLGVLIGMVILVLTGMFSWGGPAGGAPVVPPPAT